MLCKSIICVTKHYNLSFFKYRKFFHSATSTSNQVTFMVSGVYDMALRIQKTQKHNLMIKST